MKNTRPLASVFLSVALLAGCGPTVAELRAQPGRTATFPGEYHRVALCVSDWIEASDDAFLTALKHVRLQDRRDEQRARVTGFGVWLLGGHQTPLMDLEAAQLGPDVTVTVRGDRPFPEKVWPLVEACAGRRLER